MNGKATSETPSGAHALGLPSGDRPPAADARELIDAIAALRRDLLIRACRLTRNADEANDLVQDALVKAMKSVDKFQRGTNLRAWLLRLMVNVFVDRCRKRRSRPLLVPLSSDIDVSEPDRDDNPPALSEQVSYDEVRAALMQLDPAFREVYELRLVRNLSYDQISTELKIPVGTVGTRMLRARERLRRLLDPGQAPPARRPHEEVG